MKLVTAVIKPFKLDDVKDALKANGIAGITDPTDERWADLLDLAAGVPDDLLAPFLLIGRAAAEGRPCPYDNELATIYGTSSPRLIQRLPEKSVRSTISPSFSR